MIQAWHRGLIAPGAGYAFLAIDFTIAYIKYDPQWNLPGNNETEKLEFLRSTILQGVITVTALRPKAEDNEKFAVFENEIEEYKHKAPWDVLPYNETYPLKNVSEKNILFRKYSVHCAQPMSNK